MPKKNSFLEIPFIYIIFILGVLMLWQLGNLTNDETIKNTVIPTFVLLVGSFMLFVIHPKSKWKINNVSNNSKNSLFIALMAITLILFISSVIAILLGFFKNLMVANSLAMIGAIPQFVLVNAPLISIAVIVLFIAPLETMVASQLLDLMLYKFKSNYTLKDPKVYVSAGVISLGAIFYHVWAKLIPTTGVLNIHALIIVAVLFFVCALLAVKQREMESAIYTHMGNNLLAMMYKFKDVIKAFV